MERAIEISAEILSEECWTHAQVILDSGAEVNVVSQKFAVEHGLERLLNADYPQVDAVHGVDVYCYGAYWVEWRVRDAWGKLGHHRQIFYGIDREEGPPLILGMPGLMDAWIHIDASTKTWRFGVDMAAMQLLSAQEFVSAIQHEPAVYALLCAGPVRDQADKPKASLRSAAVTQGDHMDYEVTALPSELADLADVASELEAGKLPRHSEGEHAIDLIGDPPCGPIYNLSVRELAELRRFLDDALANGLVRPSTSPAGAPILFVPKKDGSLRLCVDYRGLNKITVKNRYPLPLISEILDRLSGAKWFTKLDLRDAYHRIRIRKGDEWKTAFRTRYGHFEYTVMPFGLANAPATFQAYIHKALGGLVDVCCVVYLDDILIYSMSKAQHVRDVRAVLVRLRRYSLFIKLSKCECIPIG